MPHNAEMENPIKIADNTTLYWLKKNVIARDKAEIKNIIEHVLTSFLKNLLFKYVAINAPGMLIIGKIIEISEAKELEVLNCSLK